MLVHDVGEKPLDMKIVVCFRGVRSPNEVVVVKNKHSLLPLAMFQPEETNYERRVEDNKVFGQEADLTPSSSAVSDRRN